MSRRSRRLLAVALVLGLLPLAQLAAAPASAAPTGPEVIDLGDIGPKGAVGLMNDRGQVAGGVMTGVGDQLRPVLFEAGGVVSLSGPGYELGRALDVDGQGRALVRSDGRSYLVTPGAGGAYVGEYARSISDNGWIALDASTRSPGGEVTRLAAYDGHYLEVGDVNDSGQATGIMETDPSPSRRHLLAFRAQPRQKIDVAEDKLPLYGETLGYAINNSGMVAGYGRSFDGSGYVPIVWRGGLGHEQVTLQGGIAYDINDAGTAAGFIYAPDGTHRAAIFEDDHAIDLNTLLPSGSGWVLVEATAINDRNQIAGEGLLHGKRHAFLLDLAPNGPKVLSVDAEQQAVEDGSWVPVPAAGTVDGNLVRVSAVVHNDSAYSQSVRIEFVDTSTGEVLPDGTRDEILTAGEKFTTRVEWDTRGLAWDAGMTPASDRDVMVRLSQGGVTVGAGTAELVVRPRPVVLVHGYKSNAKSSWGLYQPILSAAHPLLRGWAVGDDQVAAGTRLDTGYPDGESLDPFGPTNTIAQNAAVEHVYVEAVRRLTGAHHVDVVAHSMGGLMSRQYVQDLMPTAIDGRPVVDRLIQLGTPNQGSPCADLLLGIFNAGASAPLMPATLQLSQPYARLVFNQEVTNLRGVPISNLVGDGWVSCGPMGDIVVPTYSARWILSDTQETHTLHTDMTESAADFTAYVKPRLAMALAAAEPGARLMSATEDPAAPPAFAHEVRELAAGAEAVVPLQVPAGSAFGVVGLPAQVRMELRDPSGVVREQLTAAQAAAAPFAALGVEAHEPGAWTLVLRNEGAGAVQVPVVGWVAGGDVDVTAAAVQDDDAGHVTVTASATSDGAPLTGSAGRALLVDETGAQREVAVVDDGTGADATAGDGTWTGRSTDPLPAGGWAGTVRVGDGSQRRTTAVAVRVEPVDRSPKELTLVSQPGGSASAEPGGTTYPHGTAVRLTATPDVGRLHTGWVVDGVEQPAGPLELTMDRTHTVVARFGRYVVDEVDPVGDFFATEVTPTGINDAGQVSLISRGYVGSTTWRAGRWQGGTTTGLTGPECAPDESGCESLAWGIDEAGDVAGSSLRGDQRHATVWRGSGSLQDLHGSGTGSSAAAAINDAGRVFGSTGDSWTTWRHGAQEATTSPGSKQFWTYDGGYRMNDAGTVAGGRVTATGYFGNPTESVPATWRRGVIADLPLPACADVHGSATDVNDEGTLVGSLRCFNGHDDDRRLALRWSPAGEVSVLDDGTADGVNDAGVVVGTQRRDTGWTSTFTPTLWFPGGDAVPLASVGELCPADVDRITRPCYQVQRTVDVNDRLQVLAVGALRTPREPGAAHAGSEQRALVLTPTSATSDLAVSTTVQRPTPLPGSAVTWTATATNEGPDPATAARVDLHVPVGVTVTACESDAGACTTDGSVRRVQVPRLAPGESVTMTVTGTVPTQDGTVLTAGASAYSLAVVDENPTNDMASTTATVMPALGRPGVSWPDAVEVGGASYDVDVALTNRTDWPLTVEPVSTTGDFAATSSCPVLLARGATCVVAARFTPTAAGARSGTLTIPTSDGDHVVPLTGTGRTVNARPVLVPTAQQVGQVGVPFTLKVPFNDPDEGDVHTAQVQWVSGTMPVDATVTSEGGTRYVTAVTTFDAPVTEARALVILDDGTNDSVFGFQPYRIGTEPVEQPPANTAPVVDAGPDRAAVAGTPLTWTGTFTDAGSTSWTAAATYEGQPVPVAVTGTQLALAHTWAEAGTYDVVVTVTDAQGLTGTDTVRVTVARPNAVPVVDLGPDRSGTEGGAVLGAGSFADPDADTWTATVDHGDGTGPEPLALDGAQFLLDHVYAQDGTYTVRVRVDDGRGGVGTATQQVVVQNAAPVVVLDAVPPVVVGRPVTVTGTFTDAGRSDTHTATIEVGGSTVAGVVTDGRVTVTWTPTEAGVLPLSLRVRDDGGASGVADTSVVVRPPGQGHVTGGGWVVAPKGSCTLTPACAASELRTTFGFVVRWDAEGGRPTGSTSISTRGGALTLEARSLEWATVSRGLLQYAGHGVLGDGSPATFRVAALDGGRDGYRAQVWDASGRLVLDTARELPDASGTRDLGSGSVVVHQPTG